MYIRTYGSRHVCALWTVRQLLVVSSHPIPSHPESPGVCLPAAAYGLVTRRDPLQTRDRVSSLRTTRSPPCCRQERVGGFLRLLIFFYQTGISSVWWSEQAFVSFADFLQCSTQILAAPCSGLKTPHRTLRVHGKKCRVSFNQGTVDRPQARASLSTARGVDRCSSP